MENKNFLNIFISEFKAKWFIIVILAIILGGGLMFEKRNSGGDVIYVSTSSYAQVLAKVVPPDGVKPNEYYDIPEGGLFANGMLLKYLFMKESEKTFDYSKFNANFPLLNDENKIKWIDKRLGIASYYPNLFVFSFGVLDEDAKDVDYTNANIERYIVDYLNFCDERLQKSGMGHLEIVEKGVMPSQGTLIPGKSFVLKYGAIGAALGFAIGVLIIAGLSMKKMKKEN